MVTVYVVTKDFGGLNVVGVATTYDEAVRLREEDNERHPNEVNPRYFIGETQLDQHMHP